MAGFLGVGQRGLSLKTGIVSLVITCFLPAWVYVAYHTFESYHSKRQALDQTLLATTRNLLRNLETDLGTAEAALNALSTSSSLDSGDLARFHARASMVVRQTRGLNIVLLGAEGQQLLNTLKPFGEVLPTQPPPFFSRLIETRQRVLSDLFLGPVVQKPLISLMIPILADGHVRYGLGMSLDAPSLAGTLVQKDRPDAWVAGIFDSTGTIVARSHSPDKYVGKKGIQAVLDSRSGPPEGVTETVILEGTRVVLAYSRSERYGWTAVIAVPKEILEADLIRSLWLSLFTGATVLVAGLALALKLAGDIARPIRGLIPAATAMGNGENVTLSPLGLKEAEEVRLALVAASDLIRLRTEERDLARHNEVEISQQHRALRALSDIASLPDISATEQLRKTLAMGRRHLGMDIGIISRIEADTYTILYHDAETELALEDGQTFALGQTYCALTLDAGDVVAIANMGQSEHAGHPCYRTHKLEAYIGVPFMVGSQRFGTINFSSPHPQPHDFDLGDVEFMRLLARWIGAVLERDQANNNLLAAKNAAEAAQASLAVQAGRLAQSNADLEQFAYVASHDLRTPLRNIVSYAQLLERRYKGKLDQDGDEFIGFIIDNSMKMTDLISDLLEYSRASRQSDPLKAVSSQDALASALDNLKLDLENSKAEITVAALPPVMASDTHLVSLFQNLVGNAIKYRTPGRVPHVSIDAKPIAPDFWRFSVSDDGIGIAPEYHAKIFEIFQRLAPQDSTEGTGIGLTMCRRIVERFGGAIWVESEPGKGATFCFTLKAVPTP